MRNRVREAAGMRTHNVQGVLNSRLSYGTRYGSYLLQESKSGICSLFLSHASSGIWGLIGWFAEHFFAWRFPERYDRVAAYENHGDRLVDVVVPPGSATSFKLRTSEVIITNQDQYNQIRVGMSVLPDLPIRSFEESERQRKSALGILSEILTA